MVKVGPYSSDLIMEMLNLSSLTYILYMFVYLSRIPPEICTAGKFESIESVKIPCSKIYVTSMFYIMQ